MYHILAFIMPDCSVRLARFTASCILLAKYQLGVSLSLGQFR